MQDLMGKIKQVAIDHFNRDGYHGATIRNIANEVGCSLPMVYYYYKNKKALFHEIIKEDYFNVLRKVSNNLDKNDVIKYYTRLVCNINNLNGYDKKIYRLGIKVYLSFDGDDELAEIMDKWEQSIMPRHYETLMPHLNERDNPISIVRTLVHLLENLIESIVVKGRQLKEEDIREEISVILEK